MASTTLPQGSKERKDIPMATGLLDYFPAALAEVAKVSKAGNDKHNPGEPLHHARGKSMDHPDCIVRHLTERGTIDAEDGLRHSAKLAWRALALLQEELEAAGSPLARGARLPETTEPPAKEPGAPHVHACINAAHNMAVDYRKRTRMEELYAPDCRCACGLTHGESPTGWVTP